MFEWIMSVDPGSKSAWALWGKVNSTQYELKIYKRAINYDAKNIFDLFFDKYFDCVEFQKLKVFVEGQWFRLPIQKGQSKQYPSANFARVAKIIESRCAWIDTAKIIGIETEVIDPGKWIPAMTKGIHWKTPDERIKYCADIYYPNRKKIADENAAILLGIYCIKRDGYNINGE